MLYLPYFDLPNFLLPVYNYSLCLNRHFILLVPFYFIPRTTLQLCSSYVDWRMQWFLCNLMSLISYSNWKNDSFSVTLENECLFLTLKEQHLSHQRVTSVLFFSRFSLSNWILLHAILIRLANFLIYVDLCCQVPVKVMGRWVVKFIMKASMFLVHCADCFLNSNSSSLFSLFLLSKWILPHAILVCIVNLFGFPWFMLYSGI